MKRRRATFSVADLAPSHEASAGQHYRDPNTLRTPSHPEELVYNYAEDEESAADDSAESGKSITKKESLKSLHKKALGLTGVPAGSPPGMDPYFSRSVADEENMEASFRTGFGGQDNINSEESWPPANIGRKVIKKPINIPYKTESENYFSFLQTGRLKRKRMPKVGAIMNNEQKELTKLATALRASGHEKQAKSIKNMVKIAEDIYPTGENRSFYWQKIYQIMIEGAGASGRHLAVRPYNGSGKSEFAHIKDAARKGGERFYAWLLENIGPGKTLRFSNPSGFVSHVTSKKDDLIELTDKWLGRRTRDESRGGAGGETKNMYIKTKALEIVNYTYGAGDMGTYKKWTAPSAEALKQAAEGSVNPEWTVFKPDPSVAPYNSWDGWKNSLPEAYVIVVDDDDSGGGGGGGGGGSNAGTDPRRQGPWAAVQDKLNELKHVDKHGNKLIPDGWWGPLTQSALINAGVTTTKEAGPKAALDLLNAEAGAAEDGPKAAETKELTQGQKDTLVKYLLYDGKVVVSKRPQAPGGKPWTVKLASKYINDAKWGLDIWGLYNSEPKKTELEYVLFALDTPSAKTEAEEGSSTVSADKFYNPQGTDIWMLKSDGSLYWAPKGDTSKMMTLTQRTSRLSGNKNEVGYMSYREGNAMKRLLKGEVKSNNITDAQRDGYIKLYRAHRNEAKKGGATGERRREDGAQMIASQS